jgi:8-oxo-dGTP diphosphatase
MIHYVAGFAFTEDENVVLLVKKEKPAWQAGKLNAIGGKIEQLESAVQAMVREFQEETGLDTLEADWRRFCVLRGNQPEEWEVHFFVASLTDEHMRQASTMEHEEIVMKYVNSVGVENAIPNLPWLLQMARCMDNDLHFPVKEYIVSEQYWFRPSDSAVPCAVDARGLWRPAHHAATVQRAGLQPVRCALAMDAHAGSGSAGRAEAGCVSQSGNQIERSNAVSDAVAVSDGGVRCGVFNSDQQLCNSTKKTEVYRVAGGIADTTVAICDTHVTVIRHKKPHWCLWPQPRT